MKTWCRPKQPATQESPRQRSVPQHVPQPRAVQGLFLKPVQATGRMVGLRPRQLARMPAVSSDAAGPTSTEPVARDASVVAASQVQAPWK